MKKDIKAELIKMVTEKMATSKRLPWDSGLLNKVLMPVNAKTMKAYKGINMLILSFLGAGETSEYVTFNQCQELGGKIKKGAKSLPIVYWNRWNKVEKRPAEEGDNPDDCYAFLKFYNVFEVMAQTEGLERKRQVITRDNQPLEEAEAFITAFAEKTGVTMEHESTTKPGKGSAYYIPRRHLVQVPP
ncbi:ArdC-like ssDNA-binding domain-containing protein [Selenomonas sp. AB3002]|uniref:ArdC-like ssDNA-binding domain-containing protein n=1 Tax=Selenomonas sp. AB3002 TaxID=1392502 RepID=UPI00049581AD